MANRQITIDPLSARSLLIETTVNGNTLSTATGIIVEHNSQFYLVTNWHVLSGRDSETEQPLSPTAGIPDEIRIVHHRNNNPGSWVIKSEPLNDNQKNPIWVEHPNGMQIDIAMLPLSNIDDEVQLYQFDLDLENTDMVPQPAMPVSIIGFPFGISAGGAWPIWKTGHIATDPGINYDNRPAFLIDATTRGGMSGSPVILRMSGGFQRSSGTQVLAGGISTKFIGIYSGRIHGEAELGLVWRPNVIHELLASLN